MSSDFTVPETAIKAWFRKGAGLSLVVMENEPRPFVNRQWGVIKITSVSREGQDSVVHREAGAERLPRTRCVRLVAMTLAVESFTQEPDDFALAPLLRLQGATKWPSMGAILAAADLAYVTDTDVVNADREIDERFVSRYELNATLRWGFFVDAPASVDDNMHTIDTVQGMGGIDPGAKTPEYSATRP